MKTQKDHTMPPAKNGDTVKVHYTGKFKSGEVFDSSRDREPLEFTLGARQLIPGFENGVRGMTPGESITVEVTPGDAYGAYHDRLLTIVKKQQFPRDIVPRVGQQLQTEDDQGRPVNVRVTRIDGDNVTLDANHPLAGKTLVFEIELIEIT
ncbi:MAG: peptidylprolyl isomerase [Candidatus Zixiibacteriota bacterium]